MKPSALASKALRFALGAQSRLVTAATAVKPLPKAEFSAPTYPTGCEYILGFAKAEILPPDIGKRNITLQVIRKTNLQKECSTRRRLTPCGWTTARGLAGYCSSR